VHPRHRARTMFGLPVGPDLSEAHIWPALMPRHPASVDIRHGSPRVGESCSRRRGFRLPRRNRARKAKQLGNDRRLAGWRRSGARRRMLRAAEVHVGRRDDVETPTTDEGRKTLRQNAHVDMELPSDPLSERPARISQWRRPPAANRPFFRRYRNQTVCQPPYEDWSTPPPASTHRYFSRYIR
jgi:hypothetical protein